ncbi:hypothetical protein ABG067_008038, partial [Albugo candida]
MSEELNESELLSEIEVDDEVNDGFEDHLAGDSGLEDPVNNNKDDFNWDLSDEEEEEISIEATRSIPSFAETVASNKNLIELKQFFESEFPIGKTYIDLEEARIHIQQISRSKNISFETIRSDRNYLKMGCKHFGKYRAAKKKNSDVPEDTKSDNANDDVVIVEEKSKGDGNETAGNKDEDPIVKRPSRTTCHELK